MCFDNDKGGKQQFGPQRDGQAAYDINTASSSDTSKGSDETKVHLRLQFSAEMGSTRHALTETDKSPGHQGLWGASSAPWHYFPLVPPES